ncbi:LacI family transcriptional regulator [bacterium]|nr:MAG: LacI family transcriptional regulator [bacterium]
MPRPKPDPSKPNPSKRVTLQDVAKAAGLHVMTVSDAFSGARPVSEATREKVKRIAKELNYVPNSAARALATGRTGIIAVMAGPLDEPYFATLIRHLGLKLNAEGYRILLTPTEVSDLIDAVGNTAIDGAIAIDRHDLIEQFQKHSPTPCVSIGTHEWPFVDNVIVDMTQGIQGAMEIIFAAGRQRVAYLATAQHLAAETETRAHAYFTAITAAGLSPEVINLETNDFSEGETRLRDYLARNGHPEALLCQNDECAMSAFRVLRELGHRVPDDVMLVGCDGQRHMKYFDPPLSTVAQPLEQMAATAWQFLKNRMATPSLPLQHTVLYGELVVRDSLTAPAT